MGVEGIEPNRATTSHAFERNGFTDHRLELLPKLAHRKRLERLSLGLESKVLPLNERCRNAIALNGVTQLDSPLAQTRGLTRLVASFTESSA